MFHTSIDSSVHVSVLKIRFFSCWTFGPPNPLLFSTFAGPNPKLPDRRKQWWRYNLLAEVVKDGCLRQRAKYQISYIPVWRQPPYFFSLAVRGHPRDPLQRKIASFTLTNHDDNERKRIALKYTMLCGCIYGLKCGTVFVGMTVPWKLLPDRRTTKVRASVGPTTILPVRVRGQALILKTDVYCMTGW